MTANEPVLVFISAQIMDVQMARSLLESEGIKSYVFDDNVVRLNPFYAQAVGGIKLFVASKDVKEASEILREHLKTKGELPYSGTLAPINASTMLQNVPESIHSGDLEYGNPPASKRVPKPLSQSDLVLGFFVVGIVMALAYALLGW